MGTRTDPREMDMISTFFDVVFRVALGPVPHQQEKEKERKGQGCASGGWGVDRRRWWVVGVRDRVGGGWWLRVVERGGWRL